ASPSAVGEDLDEELMSSYVYDPTDIEQAVDATPVGKHCYKDGDRRRLKAFIQAAEKLQGASDQKLQSCISEVESLLTAGYNPIVWCRYIATANYVADALRRRFEDGNKLVRSCASAQFPESALKRNYEQSVRVIAITGELSEDEREIRLEELKSYPQRVLVATDCLSEGVNLQSHFNAVLHYDLPWNPNRLEQREGRIDRYGQATAVVKSCLLYGQDNPVDGAVLEVLIRKAVQIHKTLGITVPVPMDSTTVSEAVFKSLFDRATDAVQLSLLDLLDDGDAVAEVHKSWDRAIAREKISRTRFAQRTIKPEEVQQELIDSDQILGNESDVERFVKTACDRLSCPFIRKNSGWLLSSPPLFLHCVLGDKPRLLTFTTPTPAGVEYVGRNHPLVEGLARYILENALTGDAVLASRCGYTTTDAVAKRTTLLLLRVRHIVVTLKRNYEQLAEECVVVGFTGPPSSPVWLLPQDATSLLQQATPVSDAPKAIKQQEIAELLARLDELKVDLEDFAVERAQALSQSHRRVRSITKEGAIQVKPQLPMDILGIYILQPGKRKH
ncbi:MAG: SWF/SNF helicase family protein, partial [Nostocaceae cyanobacterium]|nr:SWF/SNF helicase family protein [Nostocaceae cyanobacterium]